MKKEHIDTNSLAHTKWNCKYHIVFAPKYRRKVFYEEKRLEIREILRQLCQWKGVEIIEGEVCPDHIHMLVSIPPKMSVSGAGMVKENFPGAEDGTVLRTADDGVLEATVPGNSSALYSSDVYNQPDGAFSVVTDENGNEWYQIQSADIESGIASVPSEKDAYSFSDMPDDTAFSYTGNGVVEASSDDGGSLLLYSGEFYNEPDAPHYVVTDDAGNTWYQMSTGDIADGVQAPSFNGNVFGFSDMPDDTSYSFGGNGIVEASSADGDSILYNSACFAEP